MGLSRRALLKQTGAVVAALGLTDLAMTGLNTKAKAYGQALANSSGRKLALLVGIDKYAAGALPPDQSSQIAGAATDVAMQKALLIYRFGFLPKDILCLTNEQATRTGIYQAFVDHLYEQAKPGDAVVFHFSGYGAQVRVADLQGGQSTVRSLVPHDGLLPSETRPALNDLSEIELKTLLKLLKTKNVTTVLDAGFVDLSVPLSGGLRSRTRSAIATGLPPAPFPLLTKQRLAQESDPFPGVLLRGAAVDDVVIERQWNGFNAGAFTYVLTQYLWTALTPVTVGRALGQSQETLLRWGGSNQQPTASGNLNVDVSQLDSGHLDLSTLAKTPPIYDTPLLSQTRGQGVIQTISADGGTSATLWLGGFPPRVLAYLGPASVLSCRGRQLKLRSRDGLTGKAKLVAEANVTPSQGDQLPLGPLKSGDPIFEAVRSLPKSIDLVVALDSRLERIERVDATSALSALAFVSSTSDTALPADCLLAKPIMGRPETITASLRPHLGIAQQPADAAAPTELPENAGYGLFSLTRSLIPGTLTFQEEAIKPAITRLTPKLRSLLALKMLRLSENRASSQVPLRVSLEIIGPERKQLINRQTLEIEQRLAPSEQGEFIPQISVGERVRYRLFNQGAQPLYYTLINVDSRERLSAFCPVTDLSAIAPGEIRSSEDMAVMAQSAIAPGSSVAIPNAELSWAIEAPPGPVETYVVGSIQPLTRTFNTLLTASVSSGSQRIDPLPEPLTLIEALLSDLSQDRSNSNTYNLNVTQWATLNFTYQTV